jgi:hypothetical protein
MVGIADAFKSVRQHFVVGLFTDLLFEMCLRVRVQVHQNDSKLTAIVIRCYRRRNKLKQALNLIPAMQSECWWSLKLFFLKQFAAHGLDDQEIAVWFLAGSRTFLTRSGPLSGFCQMHTGGGGGGFLPTIKGVVRGSGCWPLYNAQVNSDCSCTPGAAIPPVQLYPRFTYLSWREQGTFYVYLYHMAMV